MSGLIDTALGWWRHAEPRGEGRGNGEAPAAPAVNGNGSKPAEVAAPAPEPPAEPVWLKQLDRFGIPRTLVYPTTTLGRLLDQTADRFGAATALVYNNRTWTWQEVKEQTNRLAGGLARLGVRRGDRVVMTLPNCPEFVFAFFAIQKLGAVLVNAGPLMGADDLQTVFTLTSPRVVIGLDLHSPILCRAGKDSTVEHWVWVTLAFYQTVFKRIGYQFKLWHERDPKADPEQHTTLEKLMAAAPSRPPSVEPDLDRTAVLQPTGGTTGTLKLVQLSHRNFVSNATQVSAWMNGRLGQERFLAVLPMFHVYGLTIGLVTGTYLAAQIIMATRFGAAETLELIRRYKPTIFPLVPAMCDALCDELEKEAKENDTSPRIEGLRVCISGAAPLPQETSDRFIRVTGAQLIEGYGLSEAGPVTHANVPGHPRVGTIGLPMPDTRCRIVSLEDGKTDVRPGECGELLVSGPQIMSGYFSSPEQTRIALTVDDEDEEGRVWLHTGDVVRVDEEGYFHVQDRKKDMIIRSGMKVYPAKVERVLAAHELIADAAVIGRPDPVHTEEVIAMVVLKAPPEKREELADALRAYCRQHLAPYEVPAKVEFLDKLPRSALGKLMKKELRARPPLGEAGSNGNGNGNGNGHAKEKSKPVKVEPVRRELNRSTAMHMEAD
jgi:long-chain acyl-CoA synthetase